MEDNPSVDPRRLKKTRFYKNNYKLIHVTVKGKIDNKKIHLSSFNRLIKSTNERLKSSWGLFTSEELKCIREYNEYLNKIEEIKNKYTLDPKKFGLFIYVKNIKSLQQELNKGKEDFIEKVTNNDVEKDSEHIGLSTIINNSKEALIDYMISVDKNKVVLKLIRFIKSNSEYKNNEEKDSKELKTLLRI